MTRGMTALVLCTALLLMVTSSWADVVKERELLAWSAASDVSPEVGPVSWPSSGMDDQWDLNFSTNAGLTSGDNQLLGGNFAVDKFYITGGNSAGEPNQVYALNADGTLNFQFDQWSSAGWGWRDLAYDGTYLYGSDDYVVDAFDLTGAAVSAMNITGPITPCRALAYDPVSDHFWTASFSSALYEFDRSGSVIWSGSTGLTGVYGAAWDDGAADGPWLWIFDQSGTPSTTFFKFDPINHIMTGESYTVPLLPGSTDQMSGGAFFTNEFDPSYYLLGGVTQGTPDDMVFLLEMYDAADPLAPAAPTNFTATPDAGGAVSCDLAWDLPTTTVNGTPIGSYPITSVIVTRDGGTVATLGATATSYTDTPASAGEYAYGVYCINANGNGIPATASAWVGPDVPAGVENLVGEGVGELLEAQLTWDNPTTGAHGGYFAGVDGYIINRYGQETGTFTITGATTGYTDNTMTTQGWYEYGVIATNASGNGPEVLTGEFYVGPPAFEEITYDWIEINPAHAGALPGTNTGITLDDQNLGPFPMGFTFPWYDNTSYNSIRVSSNGFLSFTSTATSFTNYTIPTTSEPNNVVAPYWDDMNISSTYYGSIWYYADPAGEFFVVEYDSCNHYGSTITDEYFTFEAIFYPSGNIDFQYKAIVAGNMSPFPSATVGIENGDGTVGIECTYNGSGPWEPTSESAVRIYSVGTGTPPGEVSVDLTYVSGSPVPAGGGNLTFDVFVENYGSVALDYDAWIDVVYGTSDPITVVLRSFTNYQPGWTINRPGMYFPVPGTWPSGDYTFTGKVGINPDDVWDESGFPFTKSGSDAWTGNLEIPTNFPNPFGEVGEAVGVTAPATFALHGAYPNPFNPTTTIGFSLPEASKVTLSVFDVAGRQVAELVNGNREAGVHEAIFDATDLASGVYFYNLTAGEYNAIGKMVLMK